MNLSMEQRTDDGLSPYRTYTRAEWAALRDDMPMTLTQDEVSRLRSLHDRLDMKEVEDIYLPLSRLLFRFANIGRSVKNFRIKVGGPAPCRKPPNTKNQ